MKQIPFYSNTPDDTHCFQATFKMLLKHYFPNENYSWKELEKITAKVESLWTWPMAGLAWLADKGLDIKTIWLFDFDKFIEEGGDYLMERYGEKVAKEQIKHSDMPQEMEVTKEFIKKVPVENRVATQEDLEKLLDEGYLLICNVNAHALNGKPGFTGHFVLIYDYDKDSFMMHDPGLPASESRVVNRELFRKAWAYAKDSEGVMAFRLGEEHFLK